MFTGIVEETGTVMSFTSGASSWRLRIRARRALEGLALGDSIAVDGCCLTAAEFDRDSVTFDLLEETRRLTHFAALKDGAVVNLERSLRFDGKVGGHFVTGHIDAVGRVNVFEPRGKDHYLCVGISRDAARYVVNKGSIAIDGISLTIAETSADAFAVWLIPHTLAVTNLREKRAGDGVNLEFDLLGKYVEKMLSSRTDR